MITSRKKTVSWNLRQTQPQGKWKGYVVKFMDAPMQDPKRLQINLLHVQVIVNMPIVASAQQNASPLLIKLMHNGNSRSAVLPQFF